MNAGASARRFRRAPGVLATQGLGPHTKAMLERSRTFAALALALDYMLERAGIGGIGLFEP